MSNEKDIFEKMDALVRKHHPASTQPTSSPTAQAKSAAADIPMLTDIIAEPGLDTELRRDLIPLLTETFDPRQTQSSPAKSVLELDLDPFFTLPVAEPQSILAPKPKAEPIAQAAPVTTESIPLPKLDGPLFTEIIELNTLETPPPAQAPLETAPTSDIMSSDALAHFSDALSEQLIRAIDTRLQQTVDKKIAPQLAQTVDKALSSMLDQFSVNIEDMVREAIALELQRQLSALLNTPANSKSASSASNHSAETGDSV